jgi:hypothetical protein
MAPASSKLAVPFIAEHETHRKRTVSKRITDENFVGAESNTFTKRLKLTADNAGAASLKWKQTKSLVDKDSKTKESSPKTPSSTIEAAASRCDDADRSDVTDTEELGDGDTECEADNASDHSKAEMNAETAKTPEEQRGESTIYNKKTVTIS